MELALEIVQYLRIHASTAAAAAAVVLLVAYFLSRKPKAVRDAEARLAALRKDRGDYYQKQRPLQ